MKFSFINRFSVASFPYFCFGLLIFLFFSFFSIRAIADTTSSQNSHSTKKKALKKEKSKPNHEPLSDASAQLEEKNKQIEELTKKLEDQGIPVQANTKGIVLSGYVDASYTYNFINAPAFNRVPGFVPPPGYVGPTNAAGFAQGYPAIPGRE
ncbi:hypothetical protein A946_10360, partial [Methylacidiphilum kamchatkense Kam1]